MKWVLCTDNDGYQASLQRMKVYRVIEDRDSEEMGCVRIACETGEDYAFPACLFVPHSPNQSKNGCWHSPDAFLKS